MPIFAWILVLIYVGGFVGFGLWFSTLAANDPLNQMRGEVRFRQLLAWIVALFWPLLVIFLTIVMGWKWVREQREGQQG